MIKLLALLLGGVLLPHLASAGTITCPAGAPSNCAISIQGVPVAAAMPTDGQGLVYSAAAGAWLPLPGNGSGTVTSVALSAPSWLTVGGSPVTTTGTLALTGTSEAANLFLAAPNGSSGALTPRAIVSADFEPSLAAAVSTLCSASTTNFVRGDGTCVAPSGGGTPSVFVGASATAGTANAQTLATTVPTGFTFTNGFEVQFQVGAGLTNTGAATLSVNSTTATAVVVQTEAGLSALVGGELNPGGQYSATAETSCPAPISANCYVIKVSPSGSTVVAATSFTATAAQWKAGITREFDTAQTLTLPGAGSLSPQGYIAIQSLGQWTVTPASTDGINGGTINTSKTFGPGLWLVTTSGSTGTGAIKVAGGNGTLPITLSWGPGQNLSTAAIPFLNVQNTSGRVAIAVTCTPEVAVGGTATFDIFFAASGTALASGTKINTTSCNANGTAATDQSMGVTNATIPNGDRVGLVATGGGWSSSVGSGVVSITTVATQ